jgi:hypothetical protein
MQLVLVEWLDSRRGEGWARLEELRADLEATRCKSVGWIISRDKSSITLAGHLAENPDQCCGDMTIPAKAILSILPITLPTRRSNLRTPLQTTRIRKAQAS